MPIYEYKCNDCENTFEVLTLTSTNEEKVTCTKCESDSVSKLISAGSIRSGSGTVLVSAPAGGCGKNSGFS